MNVVKGLLQVSLLVIIAFAGDIFAKWFNIGPYGNISGMILLFCLLKMNIIPLTWVETGADFLIAELLLFFIPSAVGVIRFDALLAQEGLQLIIVIIASTISVMLCVALLTERIMQYRRKGEKM